MPRHDEDQIGKAITDKLGLRRNFFYALRRDNPECFDYIRSKDKDMVVAYRLYIEEKRLITDEASTVYFDIEDNGELLKFGRWLVEAGIYTNDLSYRYTHRSLFRHDVIKSHQTFITTTMILYQYARYISVSKNSRNASVSA